jgi:hypothetical protein
MSEQMHASFRFLGAKNGRKGKAFFWQQSTMTEPLLKKSDWTGQAVGSRSTGPTALSFGSIAGPVITKKIL